MADDIKGSVTVVYDPSTGKATLIPTLGLLDRKIQNMQWSLVAPEGWTFADPGIVFNPPPPLPPDFLPWPGSRPVRDPDECQVQARVDRQVDGPESEKYRYDIYLHPPHGIDIKVTTFVDERGNPIDPDVENQPQP